jgi:hypothetical protein
MLVRTIKQNGKKINLFNTPIVGSEKIKIKGMVYYMIIDNMKTVNRHFEVDSNVNQKKCNNCKIEKSVKYFYTDSTSQDNYHNRCKSCNDSIQKIIN